MILGSVLGPVFLMILATLIILLLGSSGKVNMGVHFFSMSPIRKEYKLILKEYCIFYNKLAREDQSVFERRVQYFINRKDFIPRGMPHITSEMKVLISAAAIQLTFGFPKVYLTHFKRILIYPDSYYSTINKVYHQGEVNPLNRIIVISWTNFVRGMKNFDDGINLGLHEMAHALRLENVIRNKEYGFLDHRLLERWEYLAYREIAAMRMGKNSIFREYGTSSEQEFFAVAVENFFERPKLFLAYNEELFWVLARVLNQHHLVSPWVQD